jgi:hypothetical protein
MSSSLMLNPQSKQTPASTGSSNTTRDPAPSAARGSGLEKSGLEKSGLEELSVKADKGERVKTQQSLAFIPRDIDVVTKRVGGDSGLKLFLKIIAGHMVDKGVVESRPQVGAEVADPSKFWKDPFVAKRTPAGDIMITIDGDPDKIRKRYEGFYIVSSDQRKVLSIGKVEGKTVIFPDTRSVPDNALIVRQPRSVIGSYLSPVEKTMLGKPYLTSLVKRTKSCTVGAACMAGLAQEKAREEAQAKAA